MKRLTGTQELGTCFEKTIPTIHEELPPPPTATDGPPIHADMLGFDGEEELKDEQAGEDKDILVLGAYYSVLDVI